MDYLAHLLDIEADVCEFISQNIKMKPLTPKQQLLYDTQEECAEKGCDKKLDRRPGGRIADRPVRDHDHITGTRSSSMFESVFMSFSLQESSETWSVPSATFLGDVNM